MLLLLKAICDLCAENVAAAAQSDSSIDIVTRSQEKFKMPNKN